MASAQSRRLAGWRRGAGCAPPSKGELPRADDLSFIPPTTKPPGAMPLLPVEPTIEGQPDPLQKPKVLGQLGDPTASVGPPSDGSGGTGGIGNNGRGGGVGPHGGPTATATAMAAS